MNWGALTIERIAIILATLSGLLLVPEVVNLLALDDIQATLVNRLPPLATAPLHFLFGSSPLKWQTEYSPDELLRVHALTALGYYANVTFKAPNGLSGV